MPASPTRLTQQARLQFVKQIEEQIPTLAIKISTQLQLRVDAGKFASVEQAQQIMQANHQFARKYQKWTDIVIQNWQKAFNQSLSTAASNLGQLGLLEDEVVEKKIIASRLAAIVADIAGESYNNLSLRVQAIEGREKLSSRDIFRPEIIGDALICAWLEIGLERATWALVHGYVAKQIAKHMASAYEAANEYLAKQQGTEIEIDLKKRLRRSNDASTGYHDHAHQDPASQMAQNNAPHSDLANHTGYTQNTGYAGANKQSMFDTQMHTRIPANYPKVSHTDLARVHQETQMLTNMSPISRVKQRAQGVIGQLKRLWTDKVGDIPDAVDSSYHAEPSPNLANALKNAQQQVNNGYHSTQYKSTQFEQNQSAGLNQNQGGEVVRVQNFSNPQEAAGELRQNAASLKEKAEKPNEKATIEIVALMFQAILAEERIPAAIRIWFARLQIPVLRLALAEPDFFATMQHPARQLIDRMGSCALGFDSNHTVGARLEKEIKRIVQVIEQYPETGRRVYQLVLDEFKKFLGESLTQNETVKEAVTLAQQIEQKEALSIKYTIELRQMLDQLHVADIVREFLFRIWSEVLALSAVRFGAQHIETLRYKQAAADLLWAVSPKSDRNEKNEVVQQLSVILTTLREGMTLLVIPADEQDAYIKLLNEVVMQAYVSRAQGLPSNKLEELAKSLAALEDVVTDDPAGDMLLDPGVIELMFGVNSETLEVISTGGSQPDAGMLQWAGELETGAWFNLDYQNALTQVQYVWNSARGQLHLLSAGSGRSYLIQTRRLAAYLQAGLLTPIEDEALTVRATRQALAQLTANPDQLLE